MGQASVSHIENINYPEKHWNWVEKIARMVKIRDGFLEIVIFNAKVIPDSAT